MFRNERCRTSELFPNFLRLPGVIINFEAMMQHIIIGLIFIAAVIYLGRLVYRSFRSGSACETGCGKCGAVDFAKLEQQLKEKGL